jgi:hypothetical protein
MNKREIVYYQPSDVLIFHGDLIHAGQAIAKDLGGLPRRDGSGWTTNHRNLTVLHDRDLSTELVEYGPCEDVKYDVDGQLIAKSRQDKAASASP